MKALPASKEWMAFSGARARFLRTGADADAAAMTNAWFDWFHSVEERRVAPIPEIREIEEVGT